MADDISLIINVKGVEDLKRAAEEFRRTGEVSRKLASEYDAVAAKNLRVIKEARRLKALKRDLRKEVDAYTKSNGKLGISQHKYVNIMKEEIRVSKEKVLTDRKLIAQEQKRARATERLKQENEKLLRLYAPITAAKKQYQRAIKDVDLALERGIITADEHSASMRRLGFEFNQFTKGLATGGNQFAKFNIEAYKSNQRMKRFASVGLQQAGYQVGDFAVQLQSGTNALVALGQQGSQLAGIFGPKGAVIGALLAVGTSIALVFQESLSAVSKSVAEIEAEIEKSFGSLQELRDIGSETSIDLQEKFGSAAGVIRDMASAAEAAAAAISGIKVSEGLEKLLTPSLFGAGEAGDLGFAGGLSSYFNPFRNITEIIKRGGLSGLEPGELDEIAQFGSQRLPEDTFKNLSEQLGGALNPEKIQAYFESLSGATPKDALGLLQDMQKSIADYPEFINKASLEGLQFVTTLQAQAEALGLLIEAYEELGQAPVFKTEIKDPKAGVDYTGLQMGERERDPSFIAAEKKRVEEYYAHREKVSRHFHEQEALLMENTAKDIEEANKRQEAAEKRKLELKKMSEAAAYKGNELAKAERAIMDGINGEHVEANRLAVIANQERQAGAGLQEAVYENLSLMLNEQAEAEKKRAEAQERADKRAMAALQIDRYRAALSKAQVDYGKNSAQARQAELNLVEEQVYQTEKLKGTSDNIIAALIDAALKHTENKQLLQDQADDAKRLAQNLAEASRAMDAIANFGLSLEQRLVKVTAENEALKAGLDDRVAGEIALLKLQKQRLITSQAIAGVDRGFLKDTIAAIDELIAKYGEQLALNNELNSKSTSGSTKVKKTIQDVIKELEDQVLQERKLLGLTEDRRREEVVFQELLEKNKELNGDLSEEQLRATAKQIASQQKANEMYEKAIGFVDGMTDAFSDFIANGLDDFKSFVGSIKDMFVRLLADLAAQAVRNRILIPIVAGVGGGLGNAAAAGTASGAVAGGGIGATLAAGAFGLGQGVSAALGIGGFTSAGLFNVSANAAVATAAGASPVMATIGAAIPPLIAVAAVIGLLTKKTKVLDTGLRATVEGFDAAIESFQVTQTSRLFGLLKGKKVTSYGAAPSAIAAPIVEAIGGIQQSVLDAAKSLGIGTGLFEDFSYKFQLSLQGLTEEQKMEKLNEELSKMGDAFASLSGHFETMNELLQVAQQRYDLETRLLTLLNDQSALLTRQRQIERATTHELNQSTLDQIYALEDAYRGVGTAFATAQRSIEARKKAITNSFNEVMESIQSRVQAASQAVSLSQSILSSLQSAAGRGIGMSREAGLSYLRSLTGQARITDQEALSEALSAVGEPTEDLFSSFVDYQREFADQSNLIRDLEEKAGKQLSADEKLLKQLQEQERATEGRHNAQLSALDAQLSKAQAQIDALNNVDTSVKSVSEAMSDLAEAIKSAQATQAEAKASSAAATGGGSKAVAQFGGDLDLLSKYDMGSNYTRTSDNKTFDRIKLTGASQLLDAASMVGVSTTGKTGAQISQAIANAGYVAVNLDSATKAQQFALGGYHSGGLRMVGERGPELEATGPSRVYSANQTRRMMQNPDLVEAVKAMKEEIVELRNEQRQLGINNNKYTKRTYDLYRQWDTEGLPAERT